MAQLKENIGYYLPVSFCYMRRKENRFFAFKYDNNRALSIEKSKYNAYNDHLCEKM